MIVDLECGHRKSIPDKYSIGARKGDKVFCYYCKKSVKVK